MVAQVLGFQLDQGRNNVHNGEIPDFRRPACGRQVQGAGREAVVKLLRAALAASASCGPAVTDAPYIHPKACESFSDIACYAFGHLRQYPAPKILILFFLCKSKGHYAVRDHAKTVIAFLL